jgi:hypothetical protein
MGLEVARGVANGEGDSRAEKRRSKGCKEVGRCGRREVYEAGRLLPGEESIEPWIDGVSSGIDVDSGLCGRCGAGRLGDSDVDVS